ncbi:MAG: hypothetical protein MUF72_23130 [Elainella sp. Prado103]|nr:hypothetical protein [Elainella sp. Prado103]
MKSLASPQYGCDIRGRVRSRLKSQRDEVFGQHWQDETWHEVLRLICGAIDPKFASELIEYLIKQEINRSSNLEDVGTKDFSDFRMSKKGLNNLMLAADCLSEVKDFSSVTSTKLTLKQHLCFEVENSEFPLSYNATEALLNRRGAFKPGFDWKSFRP